MKSLFTLITGLKGGKKRTRNYYYMETKRSFGVYSHEKIIEIRLCSLCF